MEKYSCSHKNQEFMPWNPVSFNMSDHDESEKFIIEVTKQKKTVDSNCFWTTASKSGVKKVESKNSIIKQLSFMF